MAGMGLGDFVAKTVVAKASAYRTVLISQCAGTVPFLLATLMFGWAVPDGSLVLLAALSAAMSTITLYSFYQALKLGKASIVTPVVSCLTVVAVVLSVTILGEAVSMLQILLISTVFLGMLFVAFQSSDTRSRASNVSILLALLVVFLGGGNTILLKWIAETGHYLMGFLLARFFMLGFLVLLFPMFRKETSMVAPRASLARIVLLGLIDVSAFFAWFMALREGFVSIVTPISNSSPAVTIILAHTILGERLLLHQKIGIIAILIGISALSRAIAADVHPRDGHDETCFI
jgi:drug/metabolite transporter (DMT)-like permease